MASVKRALPPFIVGAVTVGAAELSLSLLLYARAGFLRALTVLLGVQLASLAVGLATGPGRNAEGAWTVDAALSLRWRWLLSVAALGVSAVAAGGWSLLGGLGGTMAQRGVAVAALASLPLLTLGGVLAGLSARSPGTRVGAWAAAGGATGAALLGSLLLTRLLPASLLLGSTVLVAAAALVDGGLDRERFADDDGSSTDDGVLSIDALAPDGIVPVELLAPDPDRV